MLHRKKKKIRLCAVMRIQKRALILWTPTWVFCLELYPSHSHSAKPVLPDHPTQSDVNSGRQPLRHGCAASTSHWACFWWVSETSLGFNCWLSGCSESRVSYGMMLVHNIRGGRWWYGSKSWTLPLALLTSYCHVTVGCRGAFWQNGICRESAREAKACHGIPPSREKLHTLRFIDTCWTLVENECEYSGQCVSAVLTVFVSTGADLCEQGVQALVLCW